MRLSAKLLILYYQANIRGGTPYNGLYGEVPPERGTFFRLKVDERVGILLVEVYERGGKSVIWLCEGAKGLTDELYDSIKSGKRCIVVIDSHKYKGCKIVNKVCRRVIQKGHLYCEKSYTKR